MGTVRILSAGAAQAVVEHFAAAFERETGNELRADFGAVGAVKARVVGGEAVDLVILTGALIDELIALGHILPGSRTDLGRVGTGVAVRAGTPLPKVSNAHVLRGNMLAAKKIVCPDPATTTAGKVLMRAVERLGIADQVTPRMQYFPNGYAAMKWLAASPGMLEMGITQITEILANRGVTYVGPLPDELQMKTVYSAALATRAQSPEAAGVFIARLIAPSARSVLVEAGYEFE